MHISEKGFLEKIADAIPGLKGYREKESRRDTDKRLREYLAHELDRRRRGLDAVKRDFLAAGQLELLDELDRIARKLQKSADALRFASYGYGGLFDQLKIREEELDRLYAYDTDLVGEVRALEPQLAAADSRSDPKAWVSALEAGVDALNERIEGRKRLFDAPA